MFIHLQPNTFARHYGKIKSLVLDCLKIKSSAMLCMVQTMVLSRAATYWPPRVLPCPQVLNMASSCAAPYWPPRALPCPQACPRQPPPLFPPPLFPPPLSAWRLLEGAIPNPDTPPRRLGKYLYLERNDKSIYH